MLAPAIRYSGGYEIEPPLNPSEPSDTVIRLAEGNQFFLLKDGALIEKFQLVEFSVQRSCARFAIEAESSGMRWECAHSSQVLHKALTIKLLIPLVLMPSKDGLRARFSLRTESGYRVTTPAEYRKSNASQ